MKSSKKNNIIYNYINFSEWIKQCKLPTVLRINDDGEQQLYVYQRFAEHIKYFRTENLFGRSDAGQLTIIAACPATGKYRFAATTAKHIFSSKGIPVALFTPEQSKESVLDYGAPYLYIDNTPNIRIYELAYKILCYVMEKKVKVVFIDYLQLFDNSHGRHQMSFDDILKLRHVAKNYDIKIFVVLQSNQPLPSTSK